MVNVQAQTHQILVSLNAETTSKVAKNKTFVKPAMQVASFPGGNEAWEQYVKDHLEYPVIAMKNPVEGNVTAIFQVNATGEIANINIEESLGFGCDEEVKRLLLAAPHWQPATQGIFPVKSRVRIMIYFKLK